MSAAEKAEMIKKLFEEAVKEFMKYFPKQAM